MGILEYFEDIYKHVSLLAFLMESMSLISVTQHRAMWAIKKLISNWGEASNLRRDKLNE